MRALRKTVSLCTKIRLVNKNDEHALPSHCAILKGITICPFGVTSFSFHVKPYAYLEPLQGFLAS